MANTYVNIRADGVSIYPSFTDFPTIAKEGTLAVAADTGSLYMFYSGAWSVVTTSGSLGTVTSVTSSDGSLTVTNPTTNPNLILRFPLNAPNGSAGAPSYNFDSDSGMFGISDGVFGFSTNGIERFRFENNGDVVVAQGGSGTLIVNGDGNFTGNISAANYPPTISGSADTFAGYDNTGALFTIPGWNFQDGTGAPNVNINRDITLDGGFISYNFETTLEQTADTNIGMTGLNISTHLDRNNTGFDGGYLYGANFDTRSEGSGNLNEVRGFNSFAQAGNGNGGGANYVQGGSFQSNVAPGSTLNNDLNGIFVGLNSNNTTVGGGGNFVNANVDQSTFTGNFNGYISSANNSTFNNVFSLFNGYTPNTNTFNGDWNGVTIGNDAQINGFTYGFHVNLNGNMLENITGVGINTNANTLASPGFNMSGYDLNINNTTFNGDNFNGFIGFIAGTGAANTNINAFSFNNQLSGAYRFTGLQVFNNQSLTEEIRLANLNSTGNARTQTGLDITMSGNATDDGQGLRVNVSSLTSASTSNHIHSGSFEGGVFSVQSNWTPFNGVGVDVGNNLTATTNILNGFPLTGTDVIVQLIQGNLLANDDMAPGPFGLGTNMLGAVSQVGVGSGKTVPLLRSMLLGTSVPIGSGGTITEHVVLEVLGLPSFGGSVSNPTRIGIQDSQLLGANFSDGATDCWFIRVRDPNANNWFKKNLILGGSTGLSFGGYELDVTGDGMFTGNIFDSSNVTTIDPNTRNLHDSASNVSVSWGGRRLQIPSGNTVLDWGIQQIRDTSNNVVIDWQNERLQDISGNISIDWQARQLNNASNTNVFDYSGTILQFKAGIQVQTTIVSTTYIVDTGAAYDYVIFADTTGGAFTITLPAANAGRELYIKDNTGNWSTNNLSIDPNGAQIDGNGAIQAYSSAYGFVHLVADGTNWNVV